MDGFVALHVVVRKVRFLRRECIGTHLPKVHETVSVRVGVEESRIDHELICMLFAGFMFGMNVYIPVVAHATEYRHVRRQRMERVSRTNSRENLL